MFVIIIMTILYKLSVSFFLLLYSIKILLFLLLLLLVGKSKRKRLVGSTNSSGNLKGLEIQCKVVFVIITISFILIIIFVVFIYSVIIINILIVFLFNVIIVVNFISSLFVIPLDNGKANCPSVGTTDFKFDYFK